MKKFQRTIEDFECEHCGEHVEGNGYTNHCPKCLWSKHVDINPGDRQNKCQGLMEPVEVYFKNNQWHLTHQCTVCGEKATIRTKEEDDKEVMEELIKQRAKGE